MAGRLSVTNPITIALFAALLAYVYTSFLQRTVNVLGVFRKPVKTVIPPEDFVVIDDTIHCEDLHYYEPSNLIFTACEASIGTRLSWFPPIVHFNDPSPALLKGRLQVIDPKTLKTRNLVLEGFEGPFSTHGIDVISDPEKSDGEAVYIFAVNHKPNPKHYGENGKNGDSKAPKSHSVVELFHHVIGSDTARHIRTIWHPLISTPNDVLAMSPSSFFVTNDHYYREGLMRQVEDMYFGARWTNVIHVEFSGPVRTNDDSYGVKASIAVENLHNNNGLGHGRTPKEALIVSCVSARLHLGEIQGQNIQVKESIEFEAPLDNPFYFSDPYASETVDRSGFVACGPSKAIEFSTSKGMPEALEPIIVWKTSPTQKQGSKGDQKWETRVIFEDDGHRIRTASSAVLVAIDPKEEEGKRRGWLFVSGYMSKNTIAVKVDL